MPRTNRILTLGVLALVLTAVLGAAMLLINRGMFRTPTTASPTATPLPIAAPVNGQADVQNVEIHIVETDPFQVSAVVSGQLPDAGCTTISTIDQVREGRTIRVTLATTTDPLALCAQTLTPFKHEIPLEVSDLPPALYTVQVNGFEQDFELLPRDVTKFGAMLVEALNARNEELLRVMAEDDHLMLVAFWRPDGIAFATEPAIEDLLAFNLGDTPVLEADPGRDLTGLLGSTDPISILGPDAEGASAYFVSGWGLEGEDEALLYIAQLPDGGLYWYGILIGPGSFAAAAEKVSVANCAEPTANAYQLIYAAKGICFLYPEEFDVFQGENGSLTLYVRSLLNTEAPLATVSFEPVDNRTMYERYKEYLPSDFNLDIQPPTIELGGETAVILDNLPGQDLNRRVVAVHDGTLIDIMIARIGPDYGSVGEQAEALYTMITGSFQFIGVEPEAPLLAGPECPQETPGMKLFTSPDGGFCVLLPEGYAVDDSLTTGDGGTEMAVYMDSLLDASHARLFITVEDANGRTLDEIIQERQAEIEATLPGFDVMGSFGHMLDGIPANQFEQMPGQDLSRQVVTVRDGRFYTLTFVPDDTEAGGAYTEMQTLYDIVMDSFSFLWGR